MGISGVVIAIKDGWDVVEVAARLGSHPAMVMGPAQARRLAAVVDTAGPDEDEAAHRWLSAQPGVALVDVVCVHFDEPAAGAAASATL